MEYRVENMSAVVAAVAPAAAGVEELTMASSNPVSLSLPFPHFHLPLRLAGGRVSTSLRPQHLRLRGAGAGRVRVAPGGVRRGARRLCLSSFSRNCCSCSASSIGCSSSRASKDLRRSCSGLSNLRVSGISHKPFGLRQKMEQDRLHFIKVEATRGSMHEGEPVDRNRAIKTRRVVEHVALFRMTDSLTEELEMEMLDNLWSLQYRVKNILCCSVGRLVQRTPEGYTHALFSRFPTKQALDEYLENPIRWSIEQDMVIPYYDGKLSVHFEGDVEDDIETIFRRGDDFQEGLEHLLFFRFKDNISPDAADKVLEAASALPEKYSGLVQLTIGTNLDSRTKETYSYGMVARLSPELAPGQFEEALQNEPTWQGAVEAIENSESLVANFRVTPVGKTVT